MDPKIYSIDDIPFLNELNPQLISGGSNDCVDDGFVDDNYVHDDLLSILDQLPSDGNSFIASQNNQISNSKNKKDIKKEKYLGKFEKRMLGSFVDRLGHDFNKFELYRLWITRDNITMPHYHKETIEVLIPKTQIIIYHENKSVRLERNQAIEIMPGEIHSIGIYEKVQVAYSVKINYPFLNRDNNLVVKEKPDSEKIPYFINQFEFHLDKYLKSLYYSVINEKKEKYKQILGIYKDLLTIHKQINPEKNCKYQNFLKKFKSAWNFCTITHKDQSLIDVLSYINNSKR